MSFFFTAPYTYLLQFLGDLSIMLGKASSLSGRMMLYLVV